MTISTNELTPFPMNSIWITWEHQRRSTVLAKEFGATLYELISCKNRIIRYPYLLLKTLQLIKSRRPEILYVQSPSILLSVMAAFYRKTRKNFVLVVDRHSNFFPISKIPFVDLLSQLLADFALKNADITIVTNDTLRKIVENKQRVAVVLKDKLPNLVYKSKYKLDGKFKLLYPCSFFVDEPVIEVLECARLLNKDVHIYITGKYKKCQSIKDINIPENVHFVGFVSDQDYINYMNSVDAVMALTTWENTLLCSAYEAVSLNKPMILSDKKELIDYFYKGRVICDNSCEGIASAIEDMITGHSKYVQEITELKKELSNAWAQNFNNVKNTIYHYRSPFEFEKRKLK